MTALDPTTAPPSSQPSMSDEFPPSVTNLLLAWSDGDADALAELVPLVCDELRQMARRYLNRENKRHVGHLQPTALVHEFFVRLLKRRQVNWTNSEHFFGSAAQTMRVILVDEARRTNRLKRGSGETPVSLGQEIDLFPATATEKSLEVLAVHDVLDQLEEGDPRAANVVKLRFFVGMTVKETGAALGISPATVKREWEFARLWLYHKLRDKTDNPDFETPTRCDSSG